MATRTPCRAGVHSGQECRVCPALCASMRASVRRSAVAAHVGGGARAHLDGRLGQQELGRAVEEEAGLLALELLEHLGRAREREAVVVARAADRLERLEHRVLDRRRRPLAVLVVVPACGRAARGNSHIARARRAVRAHAPSGFTALGSTISLSVNAAITDASSLSVKSSKSARDTARREGGTRVSRVEASWRVRIAPNTHRARAARRTEAAAAAPPRRRHRNHRRRRRRRHRSHPPGPRPRHTGRPRAG
eukprot:4263472-Prymnesium_polylepis.2